MSTTLEAYTMMT